MLLAVIGWWWAGHSRAPIAIAFFRWTISARTRPTITSSTG
jgi:hypothetical protein